MPKRARAEYMRSYRLHRKLAAVEGPDADWRRFPDRGIMARYLGDISWETEVWCADAPTHLIHFNGERFLGPYEG